MKQPWDGATGGLRDAIWRIHTCERRPPTTADAPPVSRFPMTPAAREALRLNRLADKQKIVSQGRSRELTYGPEAA